MAKPGAKKHAQLTQTAYTDNAHAGAKAPRGRVEDSQSPPHASAARPLDGSIHRDNQLAHRNLPAIHAQARVVLLFLAVGALPDDHADDADLLDPRETVPP